jgi:predicted transcriptional regulator of viral defense system
MERHNLATITQKIYNSGFVLFHAKTLKNILGIRKKSVLFSIIKKLIKAGILSRIEKNKYLLEKKNVRDFILANFLYQPSYISFESALNFYGIISQFPYEISSATTKRPVEKQFQNKIFTYAHIQKNLSWGYEKKDNFIIASPEKALLDQLYLSSKGYKKINMDECDFTNINKSRLKKYLRQFPSTRQFQNIIKELKKYFKI